MQNTAGDSITFKFTSRDATGLPTTLSGSPAVSVYKAGSTTESTSGVTLTADYDSRTGLNSVTITTASDGSFYSNASDFDVVITAGTVDGVSVVGEVVGHFRLEAAPLKPTVAGRTLDVSSGGEAGLDWANIGSPTTTVTLSGTTVKTATDVETDTADIQSRLPAALVSGRMDASVGAMASAVLTATAIAGDAITAAKLASDVTTEIQTGLATASALTTLSGYVDTEVAAIKAVTDKLDSAMELDTSVYRFTTNALEQAPTGGSAPTASAIADAVWDEARTGHVTAGTFGNYLDAAISGVSTGGVSAGDIADAVWDEVRSEHTTTGTFGDAIDMKLSNIVADSGGPIANTPVSEDFTVVLAARGSTNLAASTVYYVQESEKVMMAMDFASLVHPGDSLDSIATLTEGTSQSITLTPIGVCGTLAKFWVEDVIYSSFYRVECKVITRFGSILEGDVNVVGAD